MLDTNICIYAMAGGNERLASHLIAASGSMCMSSVTFAELVFGAEKSQRVEQNLVNLFEFKQLVPVRPLDEDAAFHYGQMRAAMERSGQLAGANDMLIGAHARSLGITLVTNNRREFDRMPGLQVENWAA